MTIWSSSVPLNLPSPRRQSSSVKTLITWYEKVSFMVKVGLTGHKSKVAVNGGDRVM